MELEFRNVNCALTSLCGLLSRTDVMSDLYVYPPGQVRATLLDVTDSRNGRVLKFVRPVMMHYTHPTERVLLNATRDANPFFHLYEALWMLSGRNDVKPLTTYVKRMQDFSDDGQTLNGAYGYRWRKTQTCPTGIAFEEDKVDQLKVIIDHLKANPNSRRTVLQMWNVEDDLLKIGVWPDDGNAHIIKPSKDVCCNLSVMFSLRETYVNDGHYVSDVPPYKYLDMTVTNRSNDLLWGMLGANYVHFTVLQEYMAAHLGVRVGHYTHFTNNLHAYIDRPDWKPKEIASDHEAVMAGNIKDWDRIPLVSDPATFDKEVVQFVEDFSELMSRADIESARTGYSEPFLRDVALPMLASYHCHKSEDYYGRRYFVDIINQYDWKAAAIMWFAKRDNK